MQALSHFSYHQSNGQVVLCDLQGGTGPDQAIVLTDLAINSMDRCFGLTDLGPDGIKAFFQHHECNAFCKASWIKPLKSRPDEVKVAVHKSTARVGP